MIPVLQRRRAAPVVSALQTFDQVVLGYTGTTGIYWGLEDTSGTTTAADLSGNGHTLACTSFTLGQAGIVPSDAQTCAALTASSTGTSSYKPTYATAAVSYGCVVSFAAVPTGTQTLFKNFAGGVSGMQLLVNSTAKAQAYFGNGSVSGVATGVTALVNGHAYLIVATWNGTTVTLYAYDLTGRSQLTTETASLSGSSWTVPGNWAVGSSSLVAELGRVFVVPVALTSGNVASLYNAAVA